MHLAMGFELLRKDHSCNWFALLPQNFSIKEDPSQKADLQQYVRKTIITMVLATDMVKHNSQVQDLRKLVHEEADHECEVTLEAVGDDEKLWARGHFQKQEALDKKFFLLEMALHAADISNPCKPRALMLYWTEQVISEFWAQGDEERRLQLEISPMCDRVSGSKAVPKGQAGFIDFVILPLWQPLADLVAEAEEALALLKENRAFWEEKAIENALPEDIFPRR